MQTLYYLRTREGASGSRYGMRHPRHGPRPAPGPPALAALVQLQAAARGVTVFASPSLTFEEFLRYGIFLIIGFMLMPSGLN